MAIDNNVLVAWLTAKDQEISYTKLQYGLKQLEENKQRLIIPTPVLAEFLVVANNARYDFIERLSKSKAVNLAAFDARCAVECSLLTASARAKEDKFYGAEPEEGLRQKIKIDEQIVAIARVNRCETILTHDKDIHNIAKRVGIRAIRVADLPFPPQAAQLTIAGMPENTQNPASS